MKDKKNMMPYELYGKNMRVGYSKFLASAIFRDGHKGEAKWAELNDMAG